MSPEEYALACAILLNPGLADKAQTNGSIPLPEIQRQSDWALQTGSGVDALGNTYDASSRGNGTYTWTDTGSMTLPEDPSRPAMAHEMTHHLQNMAGMNAGLTPNSQARRAVEAQAYNTEKNARECLTFWGGWDEDKLGPLARKLVQGSR